MTSKKFPKVIFLSASSFFLRIYYFKNSFRSYLSTWLIHKSYHKMYWQFENENPNRVGVVQKEVERNVDG